MSRRSRARRTVILAAGALLAGIPLLTACGTPHAGAAAVVGDEQITVSSLQHKVNAVRDAQSKLANADQVQQQSGNLSSATLYSMVLDKVVDRAVDDAGITVTRAELQKFRRTQEQLAGGADQLGQVLLQRQAVAPGEIDAFFRTELGVQKLAQQQGSDLSTPEGQKTIGELLTKTSKELGVDVNPRYGKWDPNKLTIVPTADKWLQKKKQPQA